MAYRFFSKETDPRVFFCSHCGKEGADPVAVHKLDELREACDFPFVITSGYRCYEHPREASKATKSGQHPLGHGFDIAVSGGTQRGLVVRKAIEAGWTGIGVHSTFVHVDLRSGKLNVWPY